MIRRDVKVELNEHYFEWLKSARGASTTHSEVVMVLPRPGGRTLALTKSFYPEGTYNLPSGGIDPGETPELAFAREVAEETCLDVKLDSRIGLIRHRCVYGGESLDFVSHIVLGTPSSEPAHSLDSGEGICAYLDASASELRRFAAHMRSLTGVWTGFGRFRATALDFVAEWLAGAQ